MYDTKSFWKSRLNAFPKTDSVEILTFDLANYLIQENLFDLVRYGRRELKSRVMFSKMDWKETVWNKHTWRGLFLHRLITEINFE